MYSATIGSERHCFFDLVTLLAKASPLRSGDVLAGIAAQTGEERVAAQYALADLPLATFLDLPTIPYETDEVTRLIIDTHDKAAFAPVAHLTVGGLRDWLLSDAATPDTLAGLAAITTRSWRRLILATAAAISGVRPLAKAASASGVAASDNSQSRSPPTVRWAIGAKAAPSWVSMMRRVISSVS